MEGHGQVIYQTVSTQAIGALWQENQGAGALNFTIESKN